MIVKLGEKGLRRFFILLLVTALIGVTGLGWITIKEIHGLKALAESHKLLQVKPTASKASDFITRLQNELHAQPTPGSALYSWDCAPKKELAGLTVHTRLKNDKHFYDVHLFKPGVTGAAFHQINIELNQCGEMKTGSTPDGLIYLTNGKESWLQAGDVILWTDDSPVTLAGLVTGLLKATSCVSIPVTEGDLARGFYDHQDKFKGYWVEGTVKKAPPVRDWYVLTPAVQMNDAPTLLPAPENPLPADFPVPPETKVKQPVLPQVAFPLTALEENYNYQVTDLYGPGCGWAWQGLPPVNKVPTSQLQEREVTAKQQAELKLGTIYNERLTANIEDFYRWESNLFTLFDWRDYVTQLEQVNQARQNLAAAREVLRPAWEEYLTALEKVQQWQIDRQQQAAQYEKAVTECNTKHLQYELWRRGESLSTNGEVNPGINQGKTPGSNKKDDKMATDKLVGDTDEQLIPEDCVTVKKPAILDEAAPVLPVEPATPEGVTVPDGWKQKAEQLKRPVAPDQKFSSEDK